MKKRLASFILALGLIATPVSAFAKEDTQVQKDDVIEISVGDTQSDKDLELRKQIEEVLVRTKEKLATFQYLKEKMPNSVKRYKKVFDEAEKDAKRSIKAAEEFLYGKSSEDTTEKPQGKPVEKPQTKPEGKPEGKPQTKPESKPQAKPDKKPSKPSGNKPGNPNSEGFKDPKSPAYLVANGRIIANRDSGIYHLPGGQSYKKVSIENAVFYKTEKEAQAAGYRRAKR